MKARKFLFFIVILVFVFSCSKDSNSGAPANGINKNASYRSLGDSAHELLSDDIFTSINVEVVYVKGYKPSDKTLFNLKQFLNERIYKPDGITITTRAVASSGKAPFNIDEIAEIEKKERLSYNIGDEITVYIYFADGSEENDTTLKAVLGSAYRNTSIVVYGKTVTQISKNINAPDKSIVETATLEHEFGHLFGLVNVGSPMQTDHLDKQSEAHCNVPGCIMNENILFSHGLVAMSRKNPLIPFDEFCLADLQANGGK